jgi:hypothetical protein
MVHSSLQHEDAQAAHDAAPKFIKEVSRKLLANGGEVPRAGLRPIAATVMGITNDSDSKNVDALVNGVLRTNVFSWHPASDTVTFQSRAMRTYLVSTLGLKVPSLPHA